MLCLGNALYKHIKEIFISHGGQLRMNEAIKLGITRYMFYSLRDKGIIEELSRGLYRWAELPVIDEPDLVTVSLRCSKAVICLISALAYHDLTTQIPHNVFIAIPKKSHIPIFDYPPVQSYQFSKSSYEAGIVVHSISNVSVQIYNQEKTIADCFKFRNRIGMDVVLEALKLYRIRKQFNPLKLMEYARICRVQEVMRPYLETIV
jgi:predicted transcriptional regulator of viral defense system